MKDIKVKVTFINEILGTSPNDKEIYENFIGSKAPDAQSLEEEVAAIGEEEVAAKGKTVFPRADDGTPFIWDYQIRGFFKSACGFLAKVKDSKSSGLKAYKKEIDGLITVFPRKIKIQNVQEITDCQRPLRASTPKGERISLANSECINADSFIVFKIRMLKNDDEKLVKEWLDHGQYNGLCQWRNSGKGAFYWEELDEEGNVIDGNKEDVMALLEEDIA